MGLESLGALLPGIPLTITVTIGAFAFGVIFGVPLMFAKRSRFGLLRHPATFVIDLLRSVPQLVWIFIVFYGLAQVGLKLTAVPAAILALGIYSAAYMAEIYRSGLIAVPKGQWEAGGSLGMSQSFVFRRVVAPQAVVVALPSALTFLIGLIKDSSLASIIGVTEIAFQANIVATNDTSQALTIYVWAALIYLVISVAAAAGVRVLEARMRTVKA
jgi:polar amino acid transport system permease protein